MPSLSTTDINCTAASEPWLVGRPLGLGLGLAGVLLSAGLALAAGPAPVAGVPAAVAAASKRRIVHAHELLEQAQQRHQGQVAVVRVLSETVSQAAGQRRPTTNKAPLRLLSRGTHSYFSTGEVEVYQDGQTQVCVLRGEHTVLITQVKSTGAAGSLAPWTRMRQQAVEHTQVTESRVQTARGGTWRHICTVPIAPSALVGQVTRLEYWLDAQTDAVHEIAMYYPAGSRVQRAGMVFEGQTWKAADPAVDLPPLAHVLGPDQRLLPAYRGYQLLDQRAH